MTVLVVVLVLVLVVPLLGLILAARNHRLPGAPAHRRQLPHRPAPDAPPVAGPRHRVEHAHTASISADEVRRRLEAAADERDALMRHRAEP